jgi:hypothetical protein
MHWFGGSWDAPMNQPVATVEAPVGIERGHCEERVAAGESPRP